MATQLLNSIFVVVDQVARSPVSRAFLPFSCAFSRALISALADMTGPHRQSRLVLLVVWRRSLCEPLIRQSLAGNAINETVEANQGMVLDVALVQSERKFINVTAKMLLASVMIDAIDAALQHRKNAFNAIRGHVIAHVFARAVIDGIVAKAIDAAVGTGFVSMNDRAGLYVMMDGGLDCFGIGASNRHGNSSASTLAHAKNRCFADRAPASFQLFVFVLVGFLPTDEGFVDFNDALKLGKVFATASLSQTVQDEPSRLLRDADFLGQLHAGNALAGRHKQVHRINPFVQGNVAALEYRAGAHRKVFLAPVTAIEASSPCCNSLAHAANRAPWTIRPQPTLKIDPGRLLVGEYFEKLKR